MGCQPLSAQAGRRRRVNFSGLRRYADHGDPLVAACNWIALLVASNQPFYPLYLWVLVGGEWRVACWTCLSTPFFLAVPAVARRNGLWGRALLAAAGIANSLVGIEAFGEASGVALFLLPCALIALLAFRRSEASFMIVLTGAALVAWGLQDHLGEPLGRFDEEAYRAFFRLNAYSVAILSVMILWQLIRARRTSATQGIPPSPPSP